MGHGRLRASFGRPHRTRPGEIRKAVSGARTAGDQRHASVPDDGGQRPQAGGLPGARPERTIRRHGGDRPMIQDLPDEMFRWIVEAMPEAVVYSDREGIIRLWNRSAETIFGHRREDALGHTLDLIIPERWRARHWEGYRTVMRTGVTRYGREVLGVPATRGDGTRISIEFSIILRTDGDGQVLGAVGIVRAVTTRSAREQALRKPPATLEAAEHTAGRPDES